MSTTALTTTKLEYLEPGIQRTVEGISVRPGRWARSVSGFSTPDERAYWTSWY